MAVQHLHYLLAHRHHGIEAGHRVLEDHRHFVAADTLDLRRPHLQHVLTMEHHSALYHLARIGEQVHQRQGQGGLAATALPHDAQHLARLQGEAHAVDRLDSAFFRGELNPQVRDFQKGRWAHG